MILPTTIVAVFHSGFRFCIFGLDCAAKRLGAFGVLSAMRLSDISLFFDPTVIDWSAVSLSGASFILRNG
jgi:hypothetical protein